MEAPLPVVLRPGAGQEAQAAVRLDALLLDEVARVLAQLGRSAIDGDWVRSLSYPTHVVDNAKLKALGWAPAFTTRDALRAVRGG